MIPEPLGVPGASRRPGVGLGQRSGFVPHPIVFGDLGDLVANEPIHRVVAKHSAALAVKFEVGDEFRGAHFVDVIDQLHRLIHVVFRWAVGSPVCNKSIPGKVFVIGIFGPISRTVEMKWV